MKAKSDIDFGMLDLNPVFRNTSTPEIKRPEKINGFDTETADGKLFILSYAFDGFGGDVICEKDGNIDSEFIIDILTNRKCRNAHNMWFNLKFDAGVLFSEILTQEEIATLNTTNSIEKKDYKITYVPGKFLKIQRHKQSYTHYDASQFFFSSLDKASKEYLNEKKIESVDTEKFGLDESGNLNSYIRKNMKDIQFYARKDAELVRDLWEVFIDNALKFEIPVNKPFSTGFLAQQYFLKHSHDKPEFKSRKFQKDFWNTYAGGRFEIFKRGKVGKVTGLDINSAYPYHMTKIPDPKSLNWCFDTDLTLSEICEYEYGMLDITVSTRKDKIQPFPVKQDVRLFPQLKDYRLSVSLDEFKLAVDYNLIEDVKIHSVRLGESHSNTSYPFKFLADIYEQRKELESNGKYLQGLLLKIVMNSLYGKFIQTTPKRKLIEENKYEYGTKDMPLTSHQLPEEIEDKLIIENLDTGLLFNPFIASHICSRTRTQLVRFVLENNLKDELVMLATDCIMLEGEYNHNDFPQHIPDKNVSYKNQLGMWDIEYSGNGFVIAPGVYEVKGKKNKCKTRGFNPKFLKGGLQEHLAKYRGDITVERPLSMGMAVHLGKPLSQIGDFQENDLVIKPDMDNKKVWNGGDSWDELLSDKFVGRNPVISG